MYVCMRGCKSFRKAENDHTSLNNGLTEMTLYEYAIETCQTLVFNYHKISSITMRPKQVHTKL